MRWVLYPLAFIVVLIVIGLATLVAAATLAWPNLPSLETLTDYRPRIPLRVYTADGYLLGEFGEERRSVVRIGDVPPVLKQAILAAEDERFYEHPGIDPIGIARAALANLSSGGRGQGASTITMQVARNFFLTREKTYNRKLYEILLALKIEQNLSKDQILELYLNQIYLGQRAYGFSMAARTYFGKPLEQITLADAAVLAGLPKAPSAYNPIVNPGRAAARKQYVLRRMLEAGFIDETAYRAAVDAPVLTASPQRDDVVAKGDYVAEMARQIAVEQFGEEAYQLGIRIITTVTRADQLAARRALQDGVLAYDRRHGYRGPEGFVDLTGVDPTKTEHLDDLLADTDDVGDLLAALVLHASPKEVKVYRRGETLTIKGSGLRFAAPMLAANAPQARRIRPGAIVRIRQTGEREWEILQVPEVQAALVSIDAHTGAVRALVGGFDFDRNKFNHVTQALRQPGSSFKPFIYSAALERGYAPSSLVEDEPLHFPAGITGSQEWTPRNYDGKFDGLMTLRDALARSKNMVSIRLLQSITPQYAQDYVTRFGFDAERHPPFLTMALGAGSATPWQMASAYAVFANGGYRVEPYVVSQIIDGEGKVVAQVDPPVAGQSAPRVIDPRNAWLVDSMLQDVVQRGTATRARTLKRNDVAGKTGTTNEYVDAWFCGYNPDLVAVAWVGHGKARNLGRGETGASAALPIWVDYMRTALKDLPEEPRVRPDGLLEIHLADSTRAEFIYRENMPPEPPPEYSSLPVFDFAPATEAPDEALPPVPPAPLPSAPPAPAPVIERSFGAGNS
ncbi:penicillin-binding protein 1A [Pseudothauera rhizosphaerae]|uniref:Penicillin-binding protein 1A n=1 Tax=Pseudothauera rhizosphaerae TaxID=2565932 RepID=A0A4S4AL52_9RHOO|nr:penicillin-binding protein 1A [Pseudothauera rhizosphaerae]THF60216.1 penicillin-binding protein 1A [Pseudothauera rhizosphaerae]